MTAQGAAALAAGAAGGQGPVGVVDDPKVGRYSGGPAEAGGAVSAAPATVGVQAAARHAAVVRWRLGGAAEATGSAGREGFWVGKMHPGAPVTSS
jgi:hypothetical protein